MLHGDLAAARGDADVTSGIAVGLDMRILVEGDGAGGLDEDGVIGSGRAADIDRDDRAIATDGDVVIGIEECSGIGRIDIDARAGIDEDVAVAAAGGLNAAGAAQGHVTACIDIDITVTPCAGDDTAAAAEDDIPNGVDVHIRTGCGTCADLAGAADDNITSGGECDSRRALGLDGIQPGIAVDDDVIARGDGDIAVIGEHRVGRSVAGCSRLVEVVGGGVAADDDIAVDVDAAVDLVDAGRSVDGQDAGLVDIEVGREAGPADGDVTADRVDVRVSIGSHLGAVVGVHGDRVADDAQRRAGISGGTDPGGAGEREGGLRVQRDVTAVIGSLDNGRIADVDGAGTQCVGPGLDRDVIEGGNALAVDIDGRGGITVGEHSDEDLVIGLDESGGVGLREAAIGVNQHIGIASGGGNDIPGAGLLHLPDGVNVHISAGGADVAGTAEQDVAAGAGCGDGDGSGGTHDVAVRHPKYNISGRCGDRDLAAADTILPGSSYDADPRCTSRGDIDPAFGVDAAAHELDLLSSNHAEVPAVVDVNIRVQNINLYTLRRCLDEGWTCGDDLRATGIRHEAYVIP